MISVPTKILILGGTGMLGHVLFTQLFSNRSLNVYATARNSENLDRWFSSEFRQKIRTEVDVDHFDTVIRALASIQPNIVINCIGLIKQLPIADDPLSAITINSLLPHRLSLICKSVGARLIHVSTDCVFDGMKGNYKDDDPSDAKDLYGRSKFLGEVSYAHCVTLRTSIIGHELKGKLGLIEWFLAQEGKRKDLLGRFIRLFHGGIGPDHFGICYCPNPDLSSIYRYRPKLYQSMICCVFSCR